MHLVRARSDPVYLFWGRGHYRYCFPTRRYHIHDNANMSRAKQNPSIISKWLRVYPKGYVDVCVGGRCKCDVTLGRLYAYTGRSESVSVRVR